MVVNCYKKISIKEPLSRATHTIRDAEYQRDKALLCCMAAGFSPATQLQSIR